jgi:hypothetical protein
MLFVNTSNNQSLPSLYPFFILQQMQHVNIMRKITARIAAAKISVLLSVVSETKKKQKSLITKNNITTTTKKKA